ncbi:glycoside hydrolase family protein [Rhodopirellula sallentina SM41]|uniref:endo-1,4-beta-xylanase n=2 Tax=Rhodopirellula TaxID=265488 RepID=M5TRQ3_9BACT|nr:glycoside hydrolase family protein [Rhodopirellula sallentina SM41]
MIFNRSMWKQNGKWISVEKMPFANAYSIEADTRFSDPENMRVRVPVHGTVCKGDVVLISFWMRRPGAGGQPNNAYLFVDAKPESTSYQYNLSAYKEWVQHVRSFVATGDFDSSEACLRINLGEAGPRVQIARLRLVNYGSAYDIGTLPRSTIMYDGRQEDAQWRKEALARIEKIRKGDLAITVVDSGGHPVSDASVHVAMQKHAFGFGNTINSEVIGAAKEDFPVNPKKKIIVTWDEAQKYREVVRRYFDRVTFESELRPHVWKGLKGDSEGARRKRRIFCEESLPWLRSNNINVRGHYVAWAPMDFNPIEKDFVGNPDDHRKWLWEHMNDVLPATSEFVTEWDTINHIIGWGKHRYEDEYGGPEIYAEIMAEARRLAPEATHAINEGKILPDGYKREPYKKMIRFLNEQGEPADIVGFMAHFGLTSLTPPEELLRVYDDFAAIAPRLQLSEFDVDAGDDEQLQADYFRDVLIATFSHPNFEAIVQWGFWEKMHWKPSAALWRSDWSIKPAGQVFVDLVADQWWTDESLTCDDEGRCQTRGFLGEYVITVEHAGKTTSVDACLTRQGENLRIELPLE